MGRQLHRRNIFAIILLPLAGIYLAFGTPLKKKTAAFAFLYYTQGALGITAGHHRLWSHKTYEAGTLLQLYLAFFAASTLQGPILYWSRDHRLHHNHLDTDVDPYSITKGFWHAHIGWALFERSDAFYSDRRVKSIDLRDLRRNKVVEWQYHYYAPLALTAGLAIPTLISGCLWNDWKGGFVYGGLLRIFCWMQSTFCVNSLAHWLGNHPYNDSHTARDHLLTALITFGEGYHNFHHEFPYDFRNGVRWYQYDPTKWSIWLWWKLGLASGLKRSSKNLIEKGQYQQQKKLLEQSKARLDWGMPISELPLISWEDFQDQVHNGRQLICIDSAIYDVQLMFMEHPGGKETLRLSIGKDATMYFKGGLHTHTNAAHNILDDLRYAILLE